MTRVKFAILISIILLPALTLIPLGSIWLWQNGYVIAWVATSLVFTTTMYAIAASRLGNSKATNESYTASHASSSAPTANLAWAAVERLVLTIDPSSIRSRADLLDVAALTIETVAHEFHPDDKTPVWNFTVPEMLLVTERVANRLRPLFIDNVPLGEQLTVGQMMRLYEWRTVVGFAEGAYDIWRLLRVVNPIAAVTQEARERVTRQIVTSLRDDLTRRIVRMIVEEIGSASIDLYSGRLRGPISRSNAEATDPIPASKIEPEKRPKRSRIHQAWSEFGKLARGSRALYRRSARRPK